MPQKIDLDHLCSLLASGEGWFWTDSLPQTVDFLIYLARFCEMTPFAKYKTVESRERRNSLKEFYTNYKRNEKNRHKLAEETALVCPYILRVCPRQCPSVRPSVCLPVHSCLRWRIFISITNFREWMKISHQWNYCELMTRERKKEQFCFMAAFSRFINRLYILLFLLVYF